LASSGGVVVLVAFGLIALTVSDASCDDDAGSGEVAQCDGVVVVQSSAGSSSVPGAQTVVESSSTVACDMDEGEADDDAVRALQDALVVCNGQNVTVDGEYGPDTRRAVARVQAANGLEADGAFGPDTRDVMQWPARASSGQTTCVSNVSSDGS
jgi:Putative peptidoglycan binding domain